MKITSLHENGRTQCCTRISTAYCRSSFKTKRFNTESGEAKPITIADFDTQMVEQKGEFEFDNNSVPFDFNGKKLIWMDYESKKKRKIYLYDIQKEEKTELMDLKNSDGLVYHMKIFKNKVVYVKNTKEIIVLDVDSADHRNIGKTANQILALHIYDTKVTTLDKEILLREGIEVSQVIDEEENKENDYDSTEEFEYKIVTVDTKGI